MSTSTSSTRLPAYSDAFGKSFADVQSEAARYLSSGHQAPFSRVATLEDGKVSIDWVCSFWPGPDPRHPDSRSDLVLRRNTKHPHCDTVSATVLVQDDRDTHVMGVQNGLRPGMLRASLEPPAGKIDDGDSIIKTFKHEADEEIGLRPGPLFKSLKFLSEGRSVEKSPFDCARNAAVEAALRTQAASFDPSMMPKNKLSPTEECVVDQWCCSAAQLSAKVRESRASGVHTDSNIGLLAVKFDQMEQALTRPSNCSIVSALDIHDRQVRQQALTGRTGEQAGWPKNVTLQQYQGAYSIPGGTEIKKVGLHYDGPTAGSTKKMYPVSREHSRQTAIAPIIRVDGEDQVMLVKRWQPGRGNGDQDSAYCLGFPLGGFKSDCTGTDVSRVLSEYIPGNGSVSDIQILSDTGPMDADAGLSDAEDSLVETHANAHPGFNLAPSRSRQHPDCSTVFVPLENLNQGIADLTSNGTRLDLPLDSFMTKIPQIQNAIAYKDRRITDGSRQWSHALPEVLNLNPPLTQEATAIQDSFSR